MGDVIQEATDGDWTGRCWTQKGTAREARWSARRDGSRGEASEACRHAMASHPTPRRHRVRSREANTRCKHSMRASSSETERDAPSRSTPHPTWRTPARRSSHPGPPATHATNHARPIRGVFHELQGPSVHRPSPVFPSQSRQSPSARWHAHVARLERAGHQTTGCRPITPGAGRPDRAPKRDCDARVGVEKRHVPAAR